MAKNMTKNEKSSLEIIDRSQRIAVVLIYLNNNMLIAVYLLFKTLNINRKYWLKVGVKNF
jgi:hypothetical protein